MTCLVKACMWRQWRFWFKSYEAKHCVNVRLDMEELELTAAESKATYEEIKSYVAKHNDG